MPNATKTFGYSSKDITALELAISAERLQPYIVRAGGSKVKAIYVYERNTAISEALYGITQAMEIALRNSIHRTMTAAHGPMWFDQVGLLDEPQVERVKEAKAELREKRTISSGGLVAQLSLGFWTSLLAARCERSLWVPHLHKAFPNAVILKRDKEGVESRITLSRSQVFDQLESVRKLRNRIAHHEPILKMDLPTRYSEVLQALSWICPISAEWVRSTNCFKQRFHEKPLTYAAPKLPPIAESPRPGMPLGPIKT
jgi:hypothetical protein